jgi:predicted esterase
MKTSGTILIIGLVLQSLWISSPVAKAATFNIDAIHVHDKTTNLKEGITVKVGDKDTFVPQIEVVVRTSKDFQTKNIFARAYFFDASNQPIQDCQKPSAALHSVDDGVISSSHTYIWPTVLPKEKRHAIYFPLPDKLPEDWKVLIVFGTDQGAVSVVYPTGDDRDFHYPEQDLVTKTSLNPDQDIVDVDALSPLIEETVESDNPRYPTFTLILHLPHGVTDPRQVSGVLAVCLFADSVGTIRDTLNAIQPENDPNLVFAFAESHHYAILAWGARWVWSSYDNFDEMDKKEAQEWNDDFEKLASAWDHGVQDLTAKYGIPDHDYLMYGLSSGGVWVHRLALHKPGRFLAVCMHIADTYEAPTPEANHIQWLLTTGELDGGCDKARRFYTAAMAFHYPIVFKSFIGLGHANSPLADQLAISFFNYVLSLKPKNPSGNDLSAEAPPLDTSGYFSPPYYGDLMNQEMFPADQKSMIPPGFLVPLPTKEIADAWNQ